MHSVEAPVPPGWVAAGQVEGVPLWRWQHGGFHAATRDMDQLLFIGAALACFDHMSAPEFREYIAPVLRQNRALN